MCRTLIRKPFISSHQRHLTSAVKAAYLSSNMFVTTAFVYLFLLGMLLPVSSQNGRFFIIFMRFIQFAMFSLKYIYIYILESLFLYGIMVGRWLLKKYNYTHRQLLTRIIIMLITCQLRFHATINISNENSRIL